MYVCLCNGVTEGEVLEAIEAGAATVEEVAHCTGAGTRCGSCVHRLAELTGEFQAARGARLELPTPSAPAAAAVRLTVLNGARASRRMTAA